MAAATEIERLVVRLTGDGKDYQKMMHDAGKQTEKFAKGVDGRLRDAQGRFLTGQQRMNAELALAKTRMERVTIRVAAMGRALTKTGANLSKVGRSLSLRLTAPLTIIGGLSVRAFAQFDNAMIQSTSIMKVTTAQMQEMRDVALSLSGVAAQAPKELAESYFFLASAGKSAEQAMALLPRIVEFSTAGAFDMALATDLLTDAQSALGLATKDVAKDTENLIRVSDVLVKGNTLANSSVQQLSKALTTKAGAAMKSLNIELEQGTAVLLAFADQGIKGELAGNNFSRMLLLMSKGSRDNTKEWKKLGFTLFDARGNVREMADVIKNLEDVTKGMSAKAKTFTLDMLGFDARVQGAILPLLGTSDAIRRYTKELRNAKGITKEVSDKQMKSFSNQMKILRNRLTVVGIEIGEALVPVIKLLSSVLKGAMFIWNSFNRGTKSIIVTIGLLVAAIGPLLIAFGSLIQLAGFAAQGYVALAANTTALKIATIGLKAAFVGVLGLGVVVFFHAVTSAIASANKELDDSLRKLDDLEASNRKRIGDIKDPEERVRTARDVRRRLFNQVQADKAAVVAAELKQKGPLSRQTQKEKREDLGADFLARFDPIESLRKNLEKAKKLLKDHEKWMEEQGIRAMGREGITTQKRLDRIIQIRFDAMTRLAKAERRLEDLKDRQAKAGTRFSGITKKVKRTVLVPEVAKAERDVSRAKRAFDTSTRERKRAGEAVENEKKLKVVTEEALTTIDKVDSAFSSFSDQSQSAMGIWAQNFKTGIRSIGVENKKWIKTMEQGKRVTEQFLTPIEKFNKQQKELQRLLDIGAVSKSTFDRAIASAQNELFKSVPKPEKEQEKTAERFGLGRISGARFGSLEAQQRVAEFRSLRGGGEKEGVAKTNELLQVLIDQGINEADVDPKLVVKAAGLA